MKKILSFLLCISIFFAFLPAQTTYAAISWPSNVSIEADGGILIDADSGTVLYGKNIHNSYYPASITKILTALITIEQCDLNETVTFTHSAVNTLEPGASILGARVGDQLSVRDCLYALLLQSANEVANALAEHCSGSIEAFAELMNQKAEELGCTDSNFANPSGLNNEDHYTSAYDMALIAQAAFSNPTFVEIDSTLYYDVPAGQLQQYPDGWRYYAHHRMLKKSDSSYYNGIIGGKTGYTSLAGNTLVTCAERDNLKLIAVILNGHQTHYTDTKALFDFGFNNFKSTLIAEKDSTYQTLQDDLSIHGIISGQSIKLSITPDSTMILPIDADFSDVTSALTYDLDDSAPASAIARIDYTYGERLIGQAYLEAITIPDYQPPVVTVDNETVSSDSSIAESISETVSIPAATEPASVSVEQPKSTISLFSILKTILLFGVMIGIIGAIIFAVLAYREKKEEEARMIRRQNREKRRQEWGSSTEFNLIMQEHLRSKNQFRKQSFFDRMKNWLRRN